MAITGLGRALGWVMGDRAEAAAWPKWFGWLLAAALLLCGLGNLNIRIEQLGIETALLTDTEPLGIVATRGFGARAGWREIEEVEPGSVLAAAGVKPGDQIRMDQPLSYKRIGVPGERIGFTIERDGKQFRKEVVAAAEVGPGNGSMLAASFALQFAAQMLTAGLGLVLIRRRWGDPAALTLGLILFGLGINVDGVPTWSHSEATDIAFYMVVQTAALAFGLLPLFCHYLAGRPENNTERRIGVVWALAYAAIGIYGSWEIAIQHVIEWLPVPGKRQAIAWLITFVLAVVILARNTHRNDPAKRNRIRIIVAAFTLYTIAMVADGFLFFGMIKRDLAYLALVAIILLQVAALVLLVYAMLRHRLFDFTFAVNRTLVYGAISFILLAGFGLAEWGVEHLIPEEWHEAGPLWSAGIALGLFLTFHRIRDFVEHHIEGLFFREWQRKEAALERFVASASYFEDGGKLGEATVQAFRQFTGTDRVGLYWRGIDERFESQPGSDPACAAQIEADDPALVLARHDRDAVSVRITGSMLPFELVLPIIEHGRMCGFIAVGEKPDAPSYRPDEIAIMVKSTRLVGLDLLAIRARGLKEQVAGLKGQVAWFREALADLIPPGKGHFAGQ